MKNRKNLQKTTKKVAKQSRKQQRIVNPVYMKLVKQKDKKCAKVQYLTGVWDDIFPEPSRYVSFVASSNCNMKLLQEILIDFDYNKYKDVSDAQIKNMLIQAYSKFIQEHEKNILDSWSSQQKSVAADMVKNKEMTLEEVIMDDTYAISDTDLILLSIEFQICIIIFYHARQRFNLKVGHYDEQKMYCLKGHKENKFYLVSDGKTYHYNANQLRSDFVEEITKQHTASIKDKLS